VFTGTGFHAFRLARLAGLNQRHDRRDALLAGGAPLGVVLARDVLADAQNITSAIVPRVMETTEPSP